MSSSVDINSEPSLIWRSLGSLESRCRCCGADVKFREVLSAAHVVRSKGDVVFYRCSDCASISAAGEFTDFLSFEEFMWDHYLHIGAEIDSMVRPLERAGLVDGGRLLGVGCGYGFVPDYWRLITNGSATGLEPSEYGARGARELGVHVIPGYLSEIEAIRSEKFDRVFSSEVIERVPDPLIFLRELKGCLADNGVAILSTPDAGYVRPDASPSTLLAALSPGLHQVLFSKKAFEDILRKAGFRYSVVEVVGERLVAYAADFPIVLQGNSQSIRENFFRYLRHKCEQVPRASALGLGLKFRLHRALVNLGRFEEALPIGNAIVEAIKATYGFDPLSPEACREAVAGAAAPLNYAKRAPFFFPCFLFYVAMTVRHGQSVGRASASDLFACAADLCKGAQRVSVQLFREAASLYWTAVYEEGAARLVAQDRKAALHVLERVVQGREIGSTDLSFSDPPQELIDRAAIQAGVAVLQSGAAEEAMRRFREVLARLGPGDALALDAAEYWHLARQQAEDAVPRGHLYGPSESRSVDQGGVLAQAGAHEETRSTSSTAAPIVVVGQMRSGTTWLWEAFKSSPQVWVPPVKELRLLNSIDLMGASTCFQRMTARPSRSASEEDARDWYDTTWRHYLRDAATQMSGWMEKDFWNEPFHSHQAKEFEFWAMYLSKVHDLDLYEDLASRALPARMLDASPNYLSCRRDLLLNFGRRFPAAQIIIMLRDPIDHILSFTKWCYPLDDIKRSIDKSAIRDWLRKPEIAKNFSRIIDRAGQLRTAIQVFGVERIFLATMDDVARKPDAVVASLANFLRVDIPAFPRTAVNPSTTEDVSPAFMEIALGMALDEAEQLIDIIPAAATAWRDRIRAMMTGRAPEPEAEGLWSGPLEDVSLQRRS